MSYSIHIAAFEDFDLVISQALNATVSFDNSRGFSSIGVRVVVPTGGQVSFEASFDGVTFFGATFRSQEFDQYTQKTSTTGHFVGSISAFRVVRFKTTIGGSAPGSASGRLTSYQSTLEGIEHGYPPHKRGFTPIRKDFTYSTTQTGTNIWTPASGKTFIITSYTIFGSGTTDATVTIYDQTDVTGNRMLVGFFDVTVNSPIAISSFMGDCPFISAAANNSLKLTTTASINLFGVFFGYEI